MIYFGVALFLAIFSYGYDFKEERRGKKACYRIVLLILVLISGFRYRIGGDTIGYLSSYYLRIPLLSDITFDDLFLNQYEPLFFLLNCTLKTIGCKFFVLQLVHAAFINILICNYFKKHSKYPFVCVLFYFIWFYPHLNFEIMRASISIVICLYANDYFIDNKPIKGYLLYLIAIFFHYSTIILLISPLFMFLKINRKSVVFLFAIFLFGSIISSRIEQYLVIFNINDVTTDKLELYTNSDQGFVSTLSFHGIISSFLPSLLYPVVSVLKIKGNVLGNGKAETNLLQLEPFVVIGFAFYMLSCSMSILYRIVDFYKIYIIIFNSYLFVYLAKGSSKLSILKIVRTLIIFAPFFNLITTTYRGVCGKRDSNYNLYNYQKYYPYSSIFDKMVDKDRESIASNDVFISPDENYY